MRILFVCATEYQLLNAISAKLNLFAQVDADIVLQRKNSRELAERLKASGLFAEVCYANEEAMGLHDWLRKFTSGSSAQISLVDALRNSAVNGAIFLGTKFIAEDIKLGRMVHGYDRIKDYKYDELLAQNNSTLVNLFWKKLKKQDCKMSILDEGVGSYRCKNIGGKNTTADCAYLYDPRLAIYECAEFKKLPKLDFNPDVLEYANNVFGYRPSDNDGNYNDSVILFEYGCEKMPAYLTDLHGIKKVLLRNPYRKHCGLHYRYVKQVECFKAIAKKFKGNVYLKLHPRTAAGFLDEFKDSGIKQIRSYKIPWELFCLNMQLKNVTMYAILSTAVCMHPISLSENNNKYVLLYKIIEDNISKDDKAFMERLLTYYPKVFAIPTNLYGEKNE